MRRQGATAGRLSDSPSVLSGSYYSNMFAKNVPSKFYPIKASKNLHCVKYFLCRFADIQLLFGLSSSQPGLLKSVREEEEEQEQEQEVTYFVAVSYSNQVKKIRNLGQNSTVMISTAYIFNCMPPGIGR